MTIRFFGVSPRALAAGLGAAAAMMSLLACTAQSAATEQESADVQGLQQLTPTQLQAKLSIPNPFDLRPLSQEPIPQPTNSHILDKAAAIRLGKSFFWDIQTSGDGLLACGGCHASFGTDARTFNTINPGADGVFATGGVTGPNQTYAPGAIINGDNDDAIGVQGQPSRAFVAVDPDPHIASDQCTQNNDPIYGTARRVEFRQAPMIYGAAFLRNLFWAGEASHRFNGATIWGFSPNNLGGILDDQENASLASQAVGPPSNSTEMRCTGRPINGATNSMGAKMLARQPLQFQKVSRHDSVLGALANPTGGNGLVCNGQPCNYRDLISAAFGPTMAASAETQFSVIWGEALQAYESTLIPDQTPFDKFLGGRITAMTPLQIFGLATFLGRGNCATCHNGPFFSDATYRYFNEHGALNTDGGDQGFHNIGVIATNTDGGRGTFGAGGAPISDSQSLFDDWAFKTPTVRNIALSAPYFHNGAYPTLEAVVDFYDRGGDDPTIYSLSGQIKPLHLLQLEKTALVDFMKNALTDCRVLKHKAPFDRPEIQVPNGAHFDASGADGDGPCP